MSTAAPKQLRLATVNRHIRAICKHMELVQGEGYLYLIFDDGRAYDTRSIMVCHLNHLPLDRWLEEAADFAAAMKEAA